MPLSPVSGGSIETASAARVSVGRFTTKPIAPRGPCSQRRTTVRVKFGSRSCGIATKSVGARDDSSSPMAPMVATSTRLVNP